MRKRRTLPAFGAALALALTAAIAAAPARAQGVVSAPTSPFDASARLAAGGVGVGVAPAWGGAPYGGATYQLNAPYYGGGSFYSNQGYYDQGYYGQGYYGPGYSNQGYYNQGYYNQGYYNQGFNGVNFYYGAGWSSTPPAFNGYSTPQPATGLNSFGVPRLNASVPVLRP